MFDFPNAQVPALIQLEGSFAENTVESDLKRLFIDLFSALMANDAFDANVAGMAHLGSIPLVRKHINYDGLSVLQGDREESATRYLYRAWKSGNCQNRGFHFLRTYLQLLFPNDTDITQMVHEVDKEYPTVLHRLTGGYSMHTYLLGEPDVYLDGSWNLDTHYYHADESMQPDEINLFELYLTSRIEITIGETVSPRAVADLADIIKSVMPARIVATFRFWRDRVLSEPDDIDRWYLGSDAGYLGDKVLTDTASWLNR